MAEMLMILIAFTSGSLVGLCAGVIIAAVREADDFDGGYRHNHRPDEPRVRTIIYSNDITEDKP